MKSFPVFSAKFLKLSSTCNQLPALNFNHCGAVFVNQKVALCCAPYKESAFAARCPFDSIFCSFLLMYVWFSPNNFVKSLSWFVYFLWALFLRKKKLSIIQILTWSINQSATKITYSINLLLKNFGLLTRLWWSPASDVNRNSVYNVSDTFSLWQILINGTKSWLFNSNPISSCVLLSKQVPVFFCVLNGHCVTIGKKLIHDRSTSR